MTAVFIHELFNWCVRVLQAMAHACGMTYEEINIWIFCIIEPIAFIVMFFILIRQWRKIKKLKAGSR